MSLFLRRVLVYCAFLVPGFVFAKEPAPSAQFCAFCDPVVLEHQTFYEDELILALYTHKPIFPGHSLIIPKRHVERFEQLTDAEIDQIGKVIKQVNLTVQEVFGTSAYLLLQKNGREVGQTVPHVHFHYVPRQEGDDSVIKYIFKMFYANLGRPISAEEMQAHVTRLHEAMQFTDRNEEMQGQVP